MHKMIRQQKPYDAKWILENFVTDFKGQGNLSSRKNFRVDLDGDMICNSSLRLRVFKIKGMKCVTCGIDGKYFYKEKSTKDDVYFHLNLYAINSKGYEVLMTRDHIIPKSKGGKDILNNMQPMCSVCNNLKGSNFECSQTNSGI